MLVLRFILLAGCWELLYGKEQTEWNLFREFMFKYDKKYGDDPSKLASRFEIFKVLHTGR